MTKEELISQITSTINANGNQDITGTKLQEVLVSIVDTLYSAIDEATIDASPEDFTELILQSLGTRVDATMSQKAITDALTDLNYGINAIPVFARIERDPAQAPPIVNGSTELPGEIVYVIYEHPYFKEGFYWKASDNNYYTWFADAHLYKVDVNTPVRYNKLFECAEDGKQYVVVAGSTTAKPNLVILGTDSGSAVVESNDIPKFNGIIDSAPNIISGVAPTYEGIYFSVLDYTFVAKLGTDYYASWDTSHLYKDGPGVIESRLFEYNKQLYMYDGKALNLLSDMTKMAGYTYIGAATPSTTPIAITKDSKVFYIATEGGDYSNFGVGNINELSVIKSENGSWKSEGLGVPMSVKEHIQLFTGKGFNPELYVSELFIENWPEGKYLDLRKGNKAFVIIKGGVAAQIANPTQNNTVYPISVYSSSDDSYPVGTIIGYVVFKDVDGLLALSNYYTPNNSAYQSYARKLSNFPTIQKYLYGITELQGDITELQGDITEIRVDIGGGVMWELPDDNLSGSCGQKNIAEYTKKMTRDTLFDTVRINGYVVSGSNSLCDYKIYIVNDSALGNREAPVGPISSDTHTLISEGTIYFVGNIENNPSWVEIEQDGDYKNAVIKLDNTYTCEAGKQVVCYMSTVKYTYGIKFRGASNGTINENSNAALFCTGDNPFDGDSWSAGAISTSTKGYSNVALTLLKQASLLSKEAAETLIDEKIPDYIKPKIKLTIPDNVYAVVGTELNLWNDTVSLSVDKGLMSPANYHVMWSCNKGLITERGYRFTPSVSDIGIHSCTCKIYDMSNNLIDEKIFNIEVVNNYLSVQKNIVYFGDSLGGKSAKELWNNFNNSDKFSGIIPNFIGTRGISTPYHYEAVGGYGWSDYATKGRTAYRIYVNGITSASVGATYSLNNTYTLTVREVNITDGSGNMLVENTYGVAISDFPTSATIIKTNGAGDDSITYTNGFAEPNNPLWNNDTSSLDIALYRERVGLSSKIDAVSFQLGGNDNGLANNLPKLKQYIDDLYSAFIADNPNCKFLLGLTTSAGNTVGGAGVNNGASKNILSYLTNVYNIRQFYIELAQSGEYPNLIICPAHLLVDRYYGYGFSSRAISQRVSTQEQYHNNYVHPETSGYGQIGDAYLATYIKALQ